MKQIKTIFSAACIAALVFSSCNENELTPSVPTEGKLVTVHFGANSSIEPATKATLTTTEDEATFKSAWVDGDVLSVEYYNDNTTDKVDAKWVDATSSFDTYLPEHTGTWTYDALYPAPDAKGVVDFGSARTQNGNLYNSKYDLMFGEATAENAPAGKTDDGKNVIFNMDRQTGIVYFHLTSALDEEVVSATLSVSDPIAISRVKISSKGYSNGYDISSADLKDITITFEEGTAPKAKDFQLWFNVIPTTYKTMSLHVETTGNTLDVSRSAVGGMELLDAGKLYKTVKEIPVAKWVAKAAPKDLTFDFTSQPSGWPLGKDNCASGVYNYTLSGIDYSFSFTKNETGICIGGISDTSSSGYLMIYGKNAEESLGLPAISGYRLSKIVATPNNGASANTKVKVTDGSNIIEGGEEQQWNSEGNEVTYTLSKTEENTVYYLTVSKVANCQIKTLVLSYEPATPSAPKYDISISTIEGGSFSASPVRATKGTEVTLTATPDAGYAFNNDWTVKGADGNDIAVVDGKFTMPAQNVTVSGTFSQNVYSITKATAENGSFTVKKGENEVTEAYYKDVITLEATPAEGYAFSKWTVTYIDGETEKSFNPSAGTFNMPDANVTVSATFVEEAKIPVYASLAELIAAGTPTKDGTQVTVTLTDEEIIRFYTSSKNIKNGLFLKVGDQEIEIYRGSTNAVPSNWEVGGKISGTLTNCKWVLYVDKNNNETWELCPDSWDVFTYTAPLSPCATPVISIDESGNATITCETTGATIHYTVGESLADPTESDAVYSSAVTLADGQTIKAIAIAEGYKPSAVASKTYTEGGQESIVKTYRHVFDSKPSTGDNVELSKVKWNISATNLNNYNSGNYAGVQFGTSNKDGEIKLTSSYVWSYEVDGVVFTKIKEVRVWLNLGGTSVTPSVTIGEKAAISDNTKVVKNSSAGKDWTKTTKVTFTPASDGNTGVVVIDVSSVKAGYICAIEIDTEN